MRFSALVCLISISSFYLLTTSMNVTWTTLPITMPFSRRGLITAFDIHTDLIWILGGYSATGDKLQDIYQWNMTSNNFTYVGSLPRVTYSDAQNWVTKDRIIYFVHSESIRSFNMSSAMETANALDASFPHRTSSTSCVTTDGDTYLIIVGGSYPYANYTQIFNFETNAWLSSVPNLNEGRVRHTCHVYNGSVYAIAGRDDERIQVGDYEALKTVEKLALETMANWITSPHQLTNGRMDHRSVLIDDFIIVTGGWDGIMFWKSSSVEIISMVDDSIAHGGDLNIAVFGHGIVGGPMNKVLVLGGYTLSAADFPTNSNKIQISKTVTDPNISNQLPVILAIVICLVVVSCLIIVFYKMTKRNDCSDDDDPQKVNNMKTIKQIDLNIKNSDDNDLNCEGIPAPSAPVECFISVDDENRANVPFLEIKAFGERTIEMQPGADKSCYN